MGERALPLRSNFRGQTRQACALATAATVFGEKPNQRVHACEIGGVDQLTAKPFLVDQAGPQQVLQVKGEGGRGDPQTFGDGARRHAVWPLLHEQSVNRQARLVSERTERLDRVRRLHG
jgi:hypothetical protein